MVDLTLAGAGIDLERFCSLTGPDPLSPAAVRSQSPDACLLGGGAAVPDARCSLWWSATPPLAGYRVGAVGHYAAVAPRPGEDLLERACARLREAGCTIAIGPMDGSTWRRYRLLTWRGAEPPFFLEPDNPDDWPAHFSGSGFSPIAEYFSSKCEDLAAYVVDRSLDDRLRAQGFDDREIDMTRLDDELLLLWQLTSRAFAANFLYSPLHVAEFRETYRRLVRSVRPELVRVFEHRGEAIGFVFAFPDALQAARGHRIDTVVVKTLGIGPEYQGKRLADWMVDRVFAKAQALGFRQAIFALMHEANRSRKLGRGAMRDIRRYTLFSRPL